MSDQKLGFTLKKQYTKGLVTIKDTIATTGASQPSLDYITEEHTQNKFEYPKVAYNC